MEEWKQRLKSRVENMIYSQQIEDFDDVVNAFSERFQKLISGIEDSKSDPLLNGDSSEEHAEFNIERFGLALHNDFESGEINVTYKENEKSISLAIITVDKDFATVKVPDEKTEYYLSPQAIDELFKKAYEPIIN